MSRIISIVILLACASFALADARIIVDPNVKHQTITGWEATTWVAEPGDPAFPYYKDKLYDLLVNDIGINRVRLEIRSGVENDNDNWSDYQAGNIDYPTWRCRRYATVNDNSDPCVINWLGFHFSEMDWTIDNIVNPLRQLMGARGEQLYVNLNYVAFTSQIGSCGTYLHDNPAEYAEFVLAAYLHLQSKYGWVPDSWEVLLEPDNVSQWDGRLLGRAIVAAAGRLEAGGFNPAFVAPSNTNMGNAITYFDDLIQIPGALQYLKEFSYHRYGGVSDTNLQAIASRAVQHGINTSMLEWWFDNATYHILHKDLTMGRNSAWQQAVISGFFNIDDSNPSNPVISIKEVTKFNRQYYKFIRPGAIRIEATSDSADFDPVAFVNTNNRYVVVVKAAAVGNFTIDGLPSGTYGIKYTTAGQYDVDLPDQSLGAGEPLPTSIPAAGVLTVYQKCATGSGKASDFNDDGIVNFADFSFFSVHWLETNCDKCGRCAGADFTEDGKVGPDDLKKFVDENWLTGTKIPPLPEQAGNPTPSDGASYVDVNTDLSWTAGTDATTHDVYFGTSEPLPFIGNQTATTFEPGTLAQATMYYWRIDSVNDWGKTVGQVWRFTTFMPPPP
jgi:hypothetical protein